jgi:hypothetical protein
MGELHDAVWHPAAREEAVTKASAELGAIDSGYISEQKDVRAFLENLHKMSENGDVVIHWDASAL